MTLCVSVFAPFGESASSPYGGAGGGEKAAAGLGGRLGRVSRDNQVGPPPLLRPRTVVSSWTAPPPQPLLPERRSPRQRASLALPINA